MGDDLDDEAEITPDGRYVVFSSGSTNLGTGPPAPAPYDRDILVRDRVTQTTTKVGIDDATGLGFETLDFNPSISDDGTKVAWLASGTDENIELRDIAAGTTTLVTPDTKKRGHGCQGELGVHLRRGEHAGRSRPTAAGRASSRSAWATSRATRSTSTFRSRSSAERRGAAPR